MKKRLLLLTSILLSLSASPFVHAATTVVRGPYLQMATPTSMVIRWRTDATEASVVTYGLERAQMTATAKSEGVSTEHVVYVTGLKPETKYFYAVGAAPLPVPSAEKKSAAEDAP